MTTFTGRHFLALLILLGLTAPAAEATAKDLRDDCEARKAAACRELGYDYFNGEGVPQDKRQAVVLYKKACNLGDAEGCGAAGAAHVIGAGVGKDYVRAVQYFNTGCEGEDGASCLSAGYLFDHRKVELNNNDPFYNEDDQAYYFFMKACDYGNAEGCNNYGVYQVREGREDLAPMSFRKACRGGSDLGCQNLQDVCSGHTFPPAGCPRW